MGKRRLLVWVDRCIKKAAVKVLLSNGYSLNDQARKIMDLGRLGFIQKSFDVIQLSQKIREILDRSDD